MLSKRERYIAILASTLVILVALDYLLLSPLAESRDRLASERQALEQELADARKTLAASRTADRRWRDFRAAGLANNASAAETAMLNALRRWSQEAGLPLQSIRPDRASGNHGLQELTLQATGDGSLASVVRFLHQAESASLPVRVRELQITARTEGADDLSMQARVSTLWDDARSTRRSGPGGQP